jgi:hypothetical protein
MIKSNTIAYEVIREGLKALPRAQNHIPGDEIAPDHIMVVPSHRAALDPDRPLVVGNRGVGKSFWSEVLASPTTRAHVAKKLSELATVDVAIGFNASPRQSEVAPSADAIRGAYLQLADADALWRAILVRAARAHGEPPPPGAPRDDLAAEMQWVKQHREAVDRLLTALDDRVASQGRKLVLVFDALDRLGSDWTSRRAQAKALLERALSVRSYRALRLKLFMRRDQYEDPSLFQFPDSSKIKNQRVDLKWSATELYELVFSWLERHAQSQAVFRQLRQSVQGIGGGTTEAAQQALVTRIAGEYMGASAKRGRVYSWLPLHLSDASGETSPRTFLTAWREAAIQQPLPIRQGAIDHRGIHDGVRKASADRVNELSEDYPWISLALSPLRDRGVPMERAALVKLWRASGTAQAILDQSRAQEAPPPVRLETAAQQGADLEAALIHDLVAIGIVDVRANTKINIPDIFRLEAGIKRRGGPPPRRGARDA